MIRRGRREAGSGERAPTLTPEMLAQVRRIEFRTRRAVGSLLAGNYRSVFRGAGIEFAEAREYVPGDDVRRIDWNVTARMGVPWVKEFVEERELNVICAVDLSASMAAPGAREGGRAEATAELVALLAFAAVYQGDRAGLLTFTDRPERFVPSARGSRHAMRLLREVLTPRLEERRGVPATSLAAALDYLGRVLRRRSIVFLVSDFFDEGYEAALASLARRHEVIALALVDPIDLALPNAGLVMARDAEHGRPVLLDSGSRRVRDAYARAAQERTERRRAVLSQAGVDEVEVRLDQPVVDPVAEYFRRRVRER